MSELTPFLDDDAIRSIMDIVDKSTAVTWTGKGGAKEVITEFVRDMYGINLDEG